MRWLSSGRQSPPANAPLYRTGGPARRTSYAGGLPSLNYPCLCVMGEGAAFWGSPSVRPAPGALSLY